MKVGYVQIAPRLGDLAGNRERIAQAVRAAGEADLLVLPELANSGYRFESAEEAHRLAESSEDGEFVKTLRELAAETNTTLVSGLCESVGERLFNSAVLVTPTGRIEVYRKAHLFLDEKDIFEPGDVGLPVFDLGDVRIGILICFDWQFPEAWRVLALRGADIVCHPSNLVLPGLAQRSIPVHAMLNRLFAITGNRVGVERDLVFTGRSIVVSPTGQVLQEGSPDLEETAIVEIDPTEARSKRVTERNDLLADRRPDLYRDLV